MLFFVTAVTHLLSEEALKFNLIDFYLNVLQLGVLYFTFLSG